MTRKEYELVFQAFKNYRLYMTDEQEVLSEKILDDLFYPEFDKLSSDLEETVAPAEEALADEPEINGIKSLNLGAILLAKSNDALNEQIKSNLTPEQLQELKDFYVERLVDNMSTKDLVAYVTDDMTDYVNKLSPVEFFEEGYNYWEDDFDEIVEDFKGGQSEKTI